MIPAYEIIHLPSRTLGDIEVEKFDFEATASFLICKAFEYGSMEDLVEVWLYYGDEKTLYALLNAASLGYETLLLAANIFKLPLSSFLSFQSIQKNSLSSSSSSPSYNQITSLSYKQTPKNDDN